MWANCCELIEKDCFLVAKKQALSYIMQAIMCADQASWCFSEGVIQAAVAERSPEEGVQIKNAFQECCSFSIHQVRSGFESAASFLMLNFS